MPPNSTLTSPDAPHLLPAAQRLAYPILRVGFALIMLTHGMPKLLGIPHGSNTDPMGNLTKVIDTVLQFPFPAVFAVLVMLLESFGAVMLALGLRVRLVASLMTIQLLAAAYVHAPKFAWADRGMEMPLLMALVTLYLALRGSGELSLDPHFGWKY